MSERFTLNELVEDEILLLGDGYRTKRAELSDSGFRIIRVADVREGRISLDSPDFVSHEYERQIGAKRAETGDILLTTKGTVGRVAIVPPAVDKAVYSPQLCWFRVQRSDALDTRYFSYWLQSKEFLSQAAYMQGNTDMAPYISLSDLRRSTIRVPPIVKQRAIAEVLGALDDKIAANTKLAATADAYLSTLFAQLTAHEAAVQTVGDVADVNAASIKPYETRYLDYVDISSVGVGSYEPPARLDWSEAPGRARRQLKRGDTVWSTVRPNRRSHALILGDDPCLVGSTGLAVLTPRRVGFAYLFEATRTAAFTRYLENVAEGSAYPAVRASRFLDAPVPLVDESRREGFDQVAEPLRLHLDSLRRENLTLAATRDALLPQLMSGKLRVRDAERHVEELV